MSLWAGASGPVQVTSPFILPFDLLPGNPAVSFADQLNNQSPWQQGNLGSSSAWWHLLQQNNERLQTPFSQLMKSGEGRPTSNPTNQNIQETSLPHSNTGKQQTTWLQQQTGPQLQQFVVEDQSAVGVHQQQTGLQKQTGLQQWQTGLQKQTGLQQRQTGVHQQQTGLQKQTGLQQWQTGLQQPQTGLQQQQNGKNRQQHENQEDGWQYGFMEENNWAYKYYTQWQSVDNSTSAVESEPVDSAELEEIQEWVGDMEEENDTLLNDFQFYILMILPFFIFGKREAAYFIGTKLLSFVLGKLGYTDADSMVFVMFVQCVDMVALGRGRLKFAMGYQNAYYQKIYDYMIKKMKWGDVVRIGTELFMAQTGPPRYEER